MSEESEKVVGIKYLPIFPLPVVLLPNELLPLHIFEPRYRQMIKDIQVGNKLFGVSFINPEQTDRPVIGSIGCATELREIEMLEDGRSNILTFGIIRYQIDEYIFSDEQYLMAEVTFFEDAAEDLETIKPLADNVYELCGKFTNAVQKLSGGAQLPELPKTDPQSLSFLAAAAFNLSDEDKLELLKIRSARLRLEKMEKLLLFAIKEIEEETKIARSAKTNGHSNKIIDLDDI